MSSQFLGLPSANIQKWLDAGPYLSPIHVPPGKPKPVKNPEVIALKVFTSKCNFNSSKTTFIFSQRSTAFY